MYGKHANKNLQPLFTGRNRVYHFPAGQYRKTIWREKLNLWLFGLDSEGPFYFVLLERRARKCAPALMGWNNTGFRCALRGKRLSRLSNASAMSTLNVLSHRMANFVVRLDLANRQNYANLWSQRFNGRPSLQIMTRLILHETRFPKNDRTPTDADDLLRFLSKSVRKFCSSLKLRQNNEF